MWVWVGLALCIFIIYLLVQSDNKRIEQEKKEGIVLSDPMAKYLGGFPDVAGEKNVHFKIKENIIILQIQSSGTRYIPMKDIIDVGIKSETQINNEVSLGKLALFGVLAFGMDNKTTTINNYLVLSYKDKNGKRDVIIKSNQLEQLVRTIRRYRFDER